MQFLLVPLTQITSTKYQLLPQGKLWAFVALEFSEERLS